ncbi:autophagy-related protein 9A-like [Teleopsis dalmanni]|uniref:autophagy-related protein 9A-like n=1 Tax=Teleopsis dalmanni TaxID=139649 RepID=UPI0018CCD840|nr:autophagy-related protein 9A-like [Teleopsis dalmanni]
MLKRSELLKMSELEVKDQNPSERRLLTNISDTEFINDNDDTPGNSGVMIHIVPETNKARWNHIEDLDSFFTKMYNYHQKHGFTIIVLDEVFQLCEFGFVVWLLTFTIHCINFSILFGYTKPDKKENQTKVSLNDAIIPANECFEHFGGVTFCILSIAALYIMIRLIKIIYHVTQYLDIKHFYNIALHIEDNELENITWHEIKKKLQEVQAEQHMCIDKDQLTDLDIYHRILRFKNYMVALTNKNLLPVKYNIPIIGEVISLSRGLMVNVDFILFRGPGSPFQNNWQLREDYSIRNNQIELAERLSKLIIWIAIANLILAPVIFVWQIIYFVFSYANKKHIVQVICAWISKKHIT